MNDTPDINDQDLEKTLKERFDLLPQVVRDAITSADIQKQLRIVADNHKLHIDQWSILENEVMMTLLGFQEPANLQKNLINEVGVSAEEAATLATDINKIVFEPIRQELERGLSHPEAKEKEVSAEEAARTQIMSEENASASGSEAPSTQTPIANATSSVLPATPPQPKPTEKAVRAPLSSAYTARQPSSERKSVDGDPYRELP